ncbi:MAG: phosphotransferase [Oligoflexales bacterium]|nr:phosphotransferase [Oligoflexales bacterium]
MKKTIKSINEYLKKWKLHSPIELSRSSTSQVYKVSSGSRFAILKLLTSNGQCDEKYASSALRNFSGNGAINILKSDEFAQLLEYIDGGSLTKIFLEGSEYEDIKIICATLKKLHQAKCIDMLPHFSHRFISLRSRMLRDGKELDILDYLCRTAVPILEELLAEKVDEVVLHGDMHHENILFDKVRGWLAIDPKGLYGDRAYDVANIFLNPRGFDNIVYSAERISNIADVIANEMTLDPHRILKYAFVQACLSACWSLEDGDSPERAIRIAQVIRYNLLAFKSDINIF